MRITIKQIEVFIAVAQVGNVTRAAEGLNITQSATSMALADFENQLGRKLFDRIGKRLHRRLQPAARSTQALEHDAEIVGSLVSPALHHRRRCPDGGEVGIRGIGGEDWFLERFRDRSDRARDAQKTVAGPVSLADALSVLIAGVLVVGLTWIGAMMVARGELRVGELVAFYGYAGFMVLPVTLFNQVIRVVVRGMIASRAIVEMLEVESPWPDDADAAAPERPSTRQEVLHDERTGGSADFRYLREDIAALDSIRNQKTVSLNLKTREAERKRLDASRLERENDLRAAHGEPPVKSLDEIKDDASAGIILDEATQIAADFAVTSVHKVGPTQARRTDLQNELH